VSPFALSSAEVATTVFPRQTSATTSHLFNQPSSLAPQYTAVAESIEQEQPKARIRKFMSNFSVASGKKDGRWKGGESKATIPSRLLFTYVSPLLDLARERTLTENDSFDMCENQKMKYTVDTLANFYDKVRQKAQKRIEKQRQEGSDVKMKKSQSKLLLKALVTQQRRMLVVTGILRLINTAVQAFPAILVARLLRAIEAGDAYPASKALSAAAMLVSVLSLRMVIENQFFHNVLTMSTQTRGALEGLIFDKSLRLPDGGSGVLAKRGNSKEREALGSGGVLNLMQTDASTIESAAMQVHTIWDGPLQVRSSEGDMFAAFSF
jgi:hypothetical protein